MSNLFWCIMGALFSLIISALFYFIGLKRKRLTRDIETICLISKKISQVEGLEVKFNSYQIENLYFSTVKIKNIGNSVIEKNDLAPACPISISTTGMFLVNKANGIKLFSTNKANNVYPLFKINNEDLCDRITISFDYISKKEEITCSFFHTETISFDGNLKDGVIIDEEYREKYKIRIRIIIDLIGIILSLIAGGITTLSLFGVTAQ